MTFWRVLAAASVAVLLGAGPPPRYAFTAPAGDRPAGNPHRARPYDAILPSGRIVAPVGRNVVVGVNAFGVAMTPNGRYAIVSNEGVPGNPAVSRLVPGVVAVPSLAVVNLASMRVVSVWHKPGVDFYVGVVALADPADPSRTIVLASDGPANLIRVFTLSPAGRLTPEAAIRIPAPTDRSYADRGHAFPGSMTLGAGGRYAYVVDTLGDTVATIDVAKRRLVRTAPVGYFPSGIAVAGNRVLVTNEGSMRYSVLARPASLPAFSTPTGDAYLTSSLALLSLDGRSRPQSDPGAFVRMDVIPDGIGLVGGAHPSAILPVHDGRFAYVTMTNVDRIAVVSLEGSPHVADGLDLRLYPLAPYGTQPDALAVNHDGKLLYVALAGMNAVAVLDSRNPVRLHRLGLIPTGWSPSALAVSPDGRFLYVLNAKGLGQGPGARHASSVVNWATLERIRLGHLPLQRTTLSALRYARVVGVRAPNALMPQLGSGTPSSVITHVVTLVVGQATYDEVFGPDAVVSATPNLHALANMFTIAKNFYSDADAAPSGHQIATSGIATPFLDRTLPLLGTGKPLGKAGEDPEDASRAGSLFDAMARARRSYRDYGEFLNLSGYTRGRYTYDVPAPLALRGAVDVNYPNTGTGAGDIARAKAFIQDYGRLERLGHVPEYAYAWIPGRDPAQADQAVGRMVAFLSHAASWSHTAIFVMPADPGAGPDRINAHRTYALVVSPYARRGYVSMVHLSTASEVKTVEELLGLPPLSLGDLLATDMADCFTTTADDAPYNAKR
ncbi:MAG: bifunctional YncE family protein/alkaline phosphatase family protein [Vulcanimicrobiaceae bacterium]